jgi:hypothetical protein
MPDLIVDKEASLEAIAKWLWGLGLTVNYSKNELCLFHQLDQPHIKITIFNSEIKSQNTINVLGVLFNTKLQWLAQVSNATLKANCSIHAIKMINIFLPKMSYAIC